ncbi:MAG: SufS subfamily cysteine desulfurase, cysteine desulfurase / selenocysteine lyase [Candidatus Peregrinibacteria bacterium GW2011_GWF2_33_10]|nr:MAG: SufS subfamily cysteine desulfurase, cysteine desulfurase / selenocysteine lyase [Candidatus Peregrinibacteria bacterium GW2011_GWF2_33_10]OGJ44321.1 MAG: cysteine desulfurase [Candidatus Peregrinibacteria bacterium RIFOXYA2_FULL_33_21]OGJ46525.1 MAG: cysteine desulfurase [Candidatus Peregrinibacteria bacterium RIFOXYA12_FULL_33_12]OGJ50555.1 MAG: cysteine desulfurase [Candidatus Peregrinibacteria bacterium RIFOXYB2_FULL_33_20]
MNSIRSDFPILNTKVNGKDLVYFDNAATSQKPVQVSKAMEDYYLKLNANVNRGAHFLGELSTSAYENARGKVAKFVNAKKSFEIIFTRNATESLNLVARTVCENLKAGDEILLSKMEHHSNIVPWQIMAKKLDLVLKFVNLTKDFRLDMKDFEKKLSKKTKVVSISYISNVLGVINPIKEICKKAHEVGALVCIDGCQAAPHLKIDVQDLDCDFLAFSGHKMLGPQGIGVLYGKKEVLEKLPVFLGGGDMIQEVFEDHFIPAYLPNKFEAGTPNVAGAVGLGAGIDYLELRAQSSELRKNEGELTKFLLNEMQKMKFVKIIGPKDMKDRIGVISFEIKGVHPHDVGEFFNNEGIAIRNGHHCAQPLMNYLNLIAVSRLSLYLYNTKEECQRFLEVLERCWRYFGKF